MAMRFRPAEQTDLPAIARLLEGARLPTSGVAENLGNFVVAEERSGSKQEPQGTVIGVGGLEIIGPFALLRSVVVAPGRRGRGVASAICAWLEREAAHRGCAHVFLLTETAEQFFERRGYVVVSRADAPTEIASTDEFASLCPDSAVLMVRAC